MIFQKNSAVIILCGGKGKRLGAIGVTCPKCLLKINERSILEHHISTFLNFGIRDFYITIGYLAHKVKMAVAMLPVEARFNFIDTDELGTGGAIKRAVDELPANVDTFWVSMGDVYCHPNLNAMRQRLGRSNAQGVILGARVYDSRDYGILICKDDGQLLKFKEKENIKGVAIVDAGFYLLKRSVFNLFDLPDVFSIEYDLFPKIDSLLVFQHNGPWVDVGTVHRLIAARSLFSERRKIK